MAVSNELSFPETEDRFEEMCFELFRAEWNDPSCNRLGGTGQGQFGLDILGEHSGIETGIQCKHYVKKPFTLATVEHDVKLADEAPEVEIGHLIFATSAANKADLVLKIRALSRERRKAGKFTVSVMFWNELSTLLRKHKAVAREYIPGFPGGALLAVQEGVIATLEISQSEQLLNVPVRAQIAEIRETVQALKELQHLGAAPASLPIAQGTEVQPFIAKQLDLARDKLLVGKPDDALELLAALGDPDSFTDQFSKFRWHTNKAASLLALGKKEDAARSYLTASNIQPELEKAWRNKAHAFLLLGDSKASISTCEEALKQFSESTAIWALYVAARDQAKEAVPEAGVPPHVLSSSDVAFTLSIVRYKQGKLEESYDLMRQCVDADAPTLDTKRMYLATALSWVGADPIAAHMGQVTERQKLALRHALDLLSPLEATLALVQGDEQSFELSSNVTMALLVLDEDHRARSIAATALVHHPLSEGLLRIRIGELASKDDVQGLHELVDAQLADFPSVPLIALAEFAANRGDVKWNLEISAELEKRDLSLSQRLDAKEPLHNPGRTLVV